MNCLYPRKTVKKEIDDEALKKEYETTIQIWSSGIYVSK